MYSTDSQYEALTFSGLFFLAFSDITTSKLGMDQGYNSGMSIVPCILPYSRIEIPTLMTVLS